MCTRECWLPLHLIHPKQLKKQDIPVCLNRLSIYRTFNISFWLHINLTCALAHYYYNATIMSTQATVLLLSQFNIPEHSFGLILVGGAVTFRYRLWSSSTWLSMLFLHFLTLSLQRVTSHKQMHFLEWVIAVVNLPFIHIHWDLDSFFFLFFAFSQCLNIRFRCTTWSHYVQLYIACFSISRRIMAFCLCLLFFFCLLRQLFHSFAWLISRII